MIEENDEKSISAESALPNDQPKQTDAPKSEVGHFFHCPKFQ